MVILATLLACRPPPAPDPAPLREVTLDNGLRITALRHPVPPEQVTLELLVAAGSRHDEVPGTAHFVEHLAFRGARGELEAWGGPLGPDRNAHTSPEATWFHVTGSTLDPGWLDEVPRLLRQRADRLPLDPASLEAERAVLRAELEPRALDPEARRMLAALPRIGADALAAFHATWYRPDRAEVLAVGDLDPDATVAALAAAFTDWARPDSPPRDAPSAPATAPASPGGNEELLSIAVDVSTLDAAAAELVVAVAANRVGGLARASRRGDHAVIEAAGLRRRGAPPLGERVLRALSASVTPDAAEAERAGDLVRLGWIDRPFALAPTSTTWRQALHDARIGGAALPQRPREDAEALLAEILALPHDALTAAWADTWRWEALALDVVGGPPQDALEAAFRAEGARPAAAPAPPLPEPRVELQVALVEPDVAIWRLPGGGEVLYRRLDLPVVVVGADGVMGRALPEELARALAELAAPRRVVMAGPLPIPEAADAVARGLSATSSPLPPPAAPPLAPRVLAGGEVRATWAQALERPQDLEALPVLAEALEIALSTRLRAQGERHCDVAVDRVHTTLTLRARCGPTDGDRVLATVHQAVEALTRGDAPVVPRRFVPADPRDLEPTRWVEGMTERARAWPSLVDAWRAPREPAPDAPALRRLARHHLAPQ